MNTTLTDKQITSLHDAFQRLAESARQVVDAIAEMGRQIIDAVLSFWKALPPSIRAWTRRRMRYAHAPVTPLRRSGLHRATLMRR